MRIAKPEFRAAYNAAILFVDLHFLKIGPSKGAAPDVIQQWQQLSIQQALSAVIVATKAALDKYSNQGGPLDRSEKQVVAAFIGLHGHACAFLKWSSLWATHVLPKTTQKQEPGIFRSPAEFRNLDEILCSEAADRFRIAFEQLAFWYNSCRYEPDLGTWGAPPSAN